MSRGDHRGRLLLVAPEPFYEDRGTPITLRYVLEAAGELGYETDVLTFAVGRSIDIPGTRYFRTPNPLGFRSIPVGLSFRKVFFDTLLTRLLQERLSIDRYFCIHAVQEAAFPAVLLAHSHGMPVCYDMQSSLPEQLALSYGFRNRVVQRICRALERWVLSNADMVMCMPALADGMRVFAPSARIREWRYPAMTGGASATAADTDALREELGISRGAPVVLYTGTFEPYQGLPLLLEAVPTVLASAPGTVFVAVGATNEAGGDFGANVRVLERQSRERMPLFLDLADVLVCPRSHGRNLPLKVLDYMAAGRPIVATDIAAHRAVLDHDRALLVDPSSRAMAAALVTLLDDSDLAGRLGAAARDYCIENFSWRSFVSFLGETYETIRGNDS
jgi:glycosyltransferase involved in cell wall biosynthesis